MLLNFKKHINKNLPVLAKSKLLIAVSGGIDSVVLAHLSKALNLNFALAHCNFNLREDESDTDEKFVLELANQLDVEIFTQNFDTEAYAKEQKLSIQMSARALRYAWFQELATQLNFDYILTAHHADDNLETFLINFTRGTGLNGLTGIPTFNENIARPILPFSREDIEAFAKKEQIKWREDSSNSSRKYLRNKLRHEVIPILKEINPQLLDSFQNTVANLNDTADIVEESLDAVLKRAITTIDNKGITFKIIQFKKLNNPKAYLFEMFKDYGFTQWNDMVDLLDAQSGKQLLSDTHRLIKDREYLILTDLNSKEQTEDSFSISEDDNNIETPLGILIFETIETISITSKYSIYTDINKLKFPLQLRLWKEGDSFQPLGMKGKKKVSKYLKDEKSSLIEKENTWVLTSDNNIVWIVGKRADERFRVTDSTKEIIKIQINQD
jgi:tRNA(Ile)-lysidine synthase